MSKIFLIVAVTIFVSGCAGVSITPISESEAKILHSGNSAHNGYVIYEPMIVVEVSKKKACVNEDDKGICKNYETRYSAGTPFTLPDYSKPYIIDIKSGFGKVDVELDIKDGWLLSKVRDNTDNSAVLGAVEKLLGAELTAAIPGTPAKDGYEAVGLYKVKIYDSGIVLEQIKLR